MNLGHLSTGLPGLDRVLDDLRLGDNVVWQVDTVEEYRHLARAFTAAAVKSGRRLVYFRFGQHPPLLEEGKGALIHRLDPGRGFEQFSMAIRAIAARMGEEVFYIFDCLSDLLSEWSTDLMMGNFFVVTCPYLHQLRTIAYFAVLRGRHAHRTIARIRDTAQLFLDVYRREERRYVHPLKVWQRYSPTMFLPHVERGGELVPLTSSGEAAQLLSAYRRGPGDAGRRLDHWDRIFLHAAEMSGPNQEELQEQLLKMLIGRDERTLVLARRHLTLADLLQIKSRLIGSGRIGGKAAGLLLARAILREAAEIDWEAILEEHDSFFIGTDVYYTYLVENDCWHLRLAQREERTYYTAARQLRERLIEGVFPGEIREQFLEMLDYFGQAPIIVRSSSLLEDGLGNAFAGKYESVFCPNQGDLAARYDQFIRAVRRVYASTMGEEALNYRWRRGLAESDEQMALLVQRVSGTRHGAYFFPDLAGVALSRNLYVWREDMDPAAGMIRMVLGLGTRAVDRTADDYARLVALDFPTLRPEADPGERSTYTQRNADLIDLDGKTITTVPVTDLLAAGLLPGPARLSRRAPPGDDRDMGVPRLDFDHLLSKTAFPELMRAMLNTLERSYGHPVDTEFTANFRPDGSVCINLLQCRPLQIRYGRQRVAVPEDIPPAKVVFAARGRMIGGGLQLKASRLVMIDPPTYAGLSMSDRYMVARLIGRLNQLLPEEGAEAVLLGPGRWGTSTPSLGVPVSFAEISRFSALVEIAFTAAGFSPVISYGTHFFLDIVETGLSCLALRENDTINYDFFTSRPNALSSLLPTVEDPWGEVIRVIDPAASGEEIWLHADPLAERALCWCG